MFLAFDKLHWNTRISNFPLRNRASWRISSPTFDLKASDSKREVVAKTYPNCWWTPLKPRGIPRLLALLFHMGGLALKLSWSLKLTCLIKAEFPWPDTLNSSPFAIEFLFWTRNLDDWASSAQVLHMKSALKISLKQIEAAETAKQKQHRNVSRWTNRTSLSVYF